MSVTAASERGKTPRYEYLPSPNIKISFFGFTACNNFALDNGCHKLDYLSHILATVLHFMDSNQTLK